jgi:lipopolysaccharide transport system permease protein
MLAYRDFKVKYAQALLGLSWSLLNPLINLILLSFVFHKIADMQTAGVPPLLYTVVGLSVWTYCAEVFSTAGDSILGAQQMVKKIYFPRLVLPLSKALTALIDFGIVLLLTFLLLVYHGLPVHPQLLFFPVFIIAGMLAGLAGGILISALSIRFRDFKYISPVIVRVGMFVTPIAYATESVPKNLLPFYYLNPLAGVIEGVRWSLLGTAPPPVYALNGLVFLALLLGVSVLYFSRVESRIADII